MNGFFEYLRNSHPYKIGDYIKNKRVTATYYKLKDGISIPYITLNYTENKEINIEQVVPAERKQLRPLI